MRSRAPRVRPSPRRVAARGARGEPTDIAPCPREEPPTERSDEPTTLETWIARVLATPWSRTSLPEALDALSPVLSARFGPGTEVVLAGTCHDAPPQDAAADQDDDRTGVPITVSGEVCGIVRTDRGAPNRAADDPASDAEALRRAVALAGQVLTAAQGRWTRDVLEDVWSLLTPTSDALTSLDDAVERLRVATAADVAGLLEYRGGAFAPIALAGDRDIVPLAGRVTGPLRTDTPTGRVFDDGQSRFFEGFADDEPAGDAAGGDRAGDAAEGRIAALALRPIPRQAYANLQLFAANRTPRAWRPPERDVIFGAGRALRLYLDRRRRDELFARVIELERALLQRGQRDPMQLVVNALVDIVPGAEAGTILVRDGERFTFAGVTEYDRAGLEGVVLTEDELRRWYETGREGDREARLLQAPGGIEAASRRAAGDKVPEAGDLPRIVANLGMPVAHDGRWGAFVNLDAFASPHAFQDVDRLLLEAFAPIIGFVLYESDVRRELRRWASHDPLTGLANRRAFDETLRQELPRVERTGDPLALLLMDLDDFKRLNDAFGHAAGDEGLRIVARTLKDTARESDHVFRWGGDEFAALLPATDLAGALRMADRLRDAVAAADTPGSSLSLSVGVAVHAAGDGANADALLSNADASMYAAKRAAEAD